MKKLFLRLKVKRDLKKFQDFKRNFKFEFKDHVTSSDGAVFCDDICIKQDENSEWLGETETLLNVGYKFSGAMPKVLSNLFPYEFVFKGHLVQSVESIFQSLKFKSKKSQKEVLKLSGLNANRIKASAEYDWTKNQTIFFFGKAMKRESKEYQDFVDEIYVSLLQNPLFVDALKNVGKKHIIHSIGEMDKTKTTLSRYEFEYELNALKEYVLNNIKKVGKNNV